MTEPGRATYATRKWILEASHGWIKEVLEFLRFSVRGLQKVQGGWDIGVSGAETEAAPDLDNDVNERSCDDPKHPPEPGGARCHGQAHSKLVFPSIL